jgi:alanine dehydrogenase
LRQLDDIFLSKVQTLASSRYAIEEAISHADLIIGAVLVVGAAAPKLVTREMLKLIPNGAVLVDVAVDQGGCFETTHATTHSNPTYYEEGVLHYCVANMPGAVPRTSTFALTIRASATSFMKKRVRNCLKRRTTFGAKVTWLSK